jgi:antitoxin (DNA-binding transcriptional repressor) of toxin-antitoxin stability system
MEAYERMAAFASTIELRVDAYISPDDLRIEDYRGPELIAIAHAGKLITLTADGRTIAELLPERMLELLELAAAAEHEPYEAGIDTACARPMTHYHLRVERLLRDHRFMAHVAVNHYGVRALGPRWSAVLAGLRDAAGAAAAASIDAPAAAAAWDFAAAFLGPLDLGPLWAAGGVVYLPHALTAFEHAGPVYLRVGQPPQRSELYLLDGGDLIHIGESRRAVAAAPLAHWDRRARWILPCGGGTLMLGHEWKRPPRLVAHAVDLARPIYVQRG